MIHTKKEVEEISTGDQRVRRALSGLIEDSLKEVDKVSFGPDKTPY